MYYNNFKELQQTAKLGETFTETLFESAGYLVLDVSYDQEYQKQDIDFVCMQYNTQTQNIDKTVAVEAKTDTVNFESKNLIIETIANTNKNTAGWGYSTAADYVLIYQPNLARYYLLNAPLLKQHLQRSAKNYKKCRQNTPSPSDGEIWYESECVLIPIPELRKAGIIKCCGDNVLKKVA